MIKIELVEGDCEETTLYYQTINEKLVKEKALKQKFHFYKVN